MQQTIRLAAIRTSRLLNQCRMTARQAEIAWSHRELWQGTRNVTGQPMWPGLRPYSAAPRCCGTDTGCHGRRSASRPEHAALPPEHTCPISCIRDWQRCMRVLYPQSVEEPAHCSRHYGPWDCTSQALHLCAIKIGPLLALSMTCFWLQVAIVQVQLIAWNQQTNTTE